MDVSRFDAAVAELGRAPTRRRLLALLGAALVGTGGLTGLTVDADAKSKRRRRHHRGHGGKVGGGNGGTTCTPPCDPGETCQNGICTGGGGDQCTPPCGANEICRNGTCVCLPQCQGKECGDDGCGGSCGGPCAAATCQGTTLTRHTCDNGVCAPHPASCGAGQVCFQNDCCTKEPAPICNTVAIADGCGGTYPPNCPDFCCDGPRGGVVCQRLACP